MPLPPADGRERKRKTGLAIINPYGGIWADEVFETAEAARKYLHRNYPEAKPGTFKLAMAVQTVEVWREPGEPTYVPLES